MDTHAYNRVTTQICEWAQRHPSVVGVVAVGSTAAVSTAPDEWSDHDIVIVTYEGEASIVLNDLSWLPDAGRIVVQFAETEQGRSLVYEDGHLIELAVVDESDIDVLSISAYKPLLGPVWLHRRLEIIAQRTANQQAADDPDGTHRYRHLIKELIIGLGRFGRGEMFSANQRIRGSALTTLLSLIADFVPPAVPVTDILDPHRRFEQAHPNEAARLRRALEAPIPCLVDEILQITRDVLIEAAPGVELAPINAVRTVWDRVIM